MVSEFVKAACDAGFWQVSGNNIHSLPGVELVGREPRSIDIPYGLQVRAVGDVLIAYRQLVTPRADGSGFVDFAHVVVGSADDVPGIAGVLAGYRAFQRGAICTPAFDSEAMALIKRFNDHGTANALAVLTGWLAGWHHGNLSKEINL
jgi:hypothetical protein